MNLAVIEGKWIKKRNTSVRGIFDLLSDITEDSPHAYHYEMFNDATAFREIFLRLSAARGVHHIYVASHGDTNCLAGTNDVPISKTIIKNTIIQAAEGKGRLDSVYFGCCSFGNPAMLKSLLSAGGALRWVAGFENEVDFIESSAFDWLFWNAYNEIEGTALERINVTVGKLRHDVPGLMTKLGFHVGVWDGGFKLLV